MRIARTSRDEVRRPIGRQQTHFDSTQIPLAVQPIHQRRPVAARGDRLLDHDDLGLRFVNQIDREGEVRERHRDDLTLLTPTRIPCGEERLGADEDGTRMLMTRSGFHICDLSSQLEQEGSHRMGASLTVCVAEACQEGSAAGVREEELSGRRKVHLAQKVSFHS